MNATSLYDLLWSATSSVLRSTAEPNGAWSSSTVAPYVRKLPKRGFRYGPTPHTRRSMGTHQSVKLSPKYPLLSTRTFSPGSTRLAETCSARDPLDLRVLKWREGKWTHLVPAEGA